MLTSIKPMGWAFGEILTSDQIEHIDGEVAKALDGVNGGTYTLSSPLVVGGARFEVTGELRVSGTLTLTGNSVVGNSDVDTLTVVATSTFQALVTFTDGIVVTSGGAEIHGSSSFGSNLSVGSDLTVGGGLDVTGAVIIHDNLNVTTGNTFFCNAFLQVDGEAETNARLDIRAEAHVWDVLTVHSGGSLNVNGPADISGALAVTGESVFSNDVTVASGKTLRMLGTLELNTALTYEGNGRVPLRPITGSDSSADYTIEQANVIDVPNGTLTTSRTYHLKKAGAGTGDEFLVASRHTGHNLTVEPEGGTSLVLNPGNSTKPAWVRFVFVSNAWRCIEYVGTS